MLSRVALDRGVESLQTIADIFGQLSAGMVAVRIAPACNGLLAANPTRPPRVNGADTPACGFGSMARVLATGATGFIGSQLARRLVADGDDVTCLVRFTLGDVRDRDSMCAALAGTDAPAASLPERSRETSDWYQQQNWI